MTCTPKATGLHQSRRCCELGGAICLKVRSQLFLWLVLQKLKDYTSLEDAVCINLNLVTLLCEESNPVLPLIPGFTSQGPLTKAKNIKWLVFAGNIQTADSKISVLMEKLICYQNNITESIQLQSSAFFSSQERKTPATHRLTGKFDVLVIIYTRELISTQNMWHRYLWWSLCAVYLHACQVRVTVGNSGLCCCTCIMYFECQLTPLCVDSAWALWASFSFRFVVFQCVFEYPLKWCTYSAVCGDWEVWGDCIYLSRMKSCTSWMERGWRWTLR